MRKIYLFIGLIISLVFTVSVGKFLSAFNSKMNLNIETNGVMTSLVENNGKSYDSTSNSDDDNNPISDDDNNSISDNDNNSISDVNKTNNSILSKSSSSFNVLSSESDSLFNNITSYRLNNSLDKLNSDQDIDLYISDTLISAVINNNPISNPTYPYFSFKTITLDNSNILNQITSDLNFTTYISNELYKLMSTFVISDGIDNYVIIAFR